MRHHLRGGKDQEQRVTREAKKMHRPCETTRQVRPPGMRAPLRRRSLSIPLRLRRHREPLIPPGHKAPRMSTDQKVLWGVSGVFLMGVAYSLWISMQVIGCCG